MHTLTELDIWQVWPLEQSRTEPDLNFQYPNHEILMLARPHRELRVPFDRIGVALE
jgi:hypothetical protein